MDFPPLSVTKAGIVPQLETAAKTDAGDNRKIIRVGDYAINSRSDRKGSGGISKYEGSTSQISIVLEPQNILPKFAHHLLRSYAFQEEFYRWGHGIVADLWTTRYSDMKNILLSIPDPDTQHEIADFLDRETARIDLLIEKKRDFVNLLKEKRQTIISHAVTKGLNPNAPMKPSGIEWLGEVPEHWEVKRLKRVCSAFPSNVDKKSYEGETPVRLCNYTDVYVQRRDPPGWTSWRQRHQRDLSQSVTLRAGDTIITKDSESADDIAVAAYVPDDLPGVAMRLSSFNDPTVERHRRCIREKVF